MIMPTVESVSVGETKNTPKTEDECICSKCGYTVNNKDGKACDTIKCPACKGSMAKGAVSDSSAKDTSKNDHILYRTNSFVSLLEQSSDSDSIIKTKNTRHYQYYDVRTQLIKPSHREARAVIMKSAYSKKGDYIGSSVRAFRFVSVYGIKSFEKGNPKDTVCTIGFSPEQKRWFGWSHRGIHGFGIGSKHKNSYASNLNQAKRMAIAFANSIS